MLYQLSEIERMLDANRPLFVRFSQGYAADLVVGSADPETGLSLPGLTALPLDPEPWWSLPAAEWIARQLARFHRDEAHFAWLLRGTVVGRSAGGEPLIGDVEVVGRLADSLLDQADRVWRERFDAAVGATEAELVSVAHA
jgi:hypothetical protein